MTIEKLPSGNYRITQMSGGKRYRITVDHRPSNAEAVRLMADKLNKGNTRTVDMTFYDASIAYIESKANILSPSTIRSYYGLLKAVDGHFRDRHVLDITPIMVQSLVNDFSACHAPKTVSNFSNFVMSVLKSCEIEIKSPKLPQKEKKSPYIPTEDEVGRILEYFRGTEYEVAISLAVFGLRRSEICALTLDDLDGNTVTINKAKVLNEKQEWVIKRTKTTESTRTIVIPESISAKIRDQGYVYNGCPNGIYKNLQTAQDRLGIKRFPLHKLRHFYASYLHNDGFTDKQIQEMGGWKTDNVMKTVYQHAMDMEKAKKNAAKSIGSIFRG